ncbi:hypothetical protein AYI70_g848 [Smittium culicis]|uniref:Uncharacterized protein n=1 Tax=Smittium culicis TaxID=133412 RepID=A0A1R1YF55_9FUNG|nr:hypothetical protein AYI70_g848 [Smittium culicis]
MLYERPKIQSPNQKSILNPRTYNFKKSATLTNPQQIRNCKYSTKAVPKFKGPQCSGCGAEFQNENKAQPGYLPSDLWEKFHNLKTAPKSLDSIVLDGRIPSTIEKESSQDKPYDMTKTLSPEIAVQILNELQDSENSDNLGVNKAENEIVETVQKIKEVKTGQEIVERILCQRCFTIQNYNRVDHNWKKDIVNDPKALQFLKYNFQALVVVVVDLYDIPISFIPNLSQFIGENQRIILVANKSDLLPADANYSRLKLWLAKQAQIMKVDNIRSIHFVSAQNNFNIRELAADIQNSRKPHQDVFFVGRANVGKSELINSLLRISYKTYYKHKLVASQIPGTTIGLNGIPLAAFRKSLVPMGPIHDGKEDSSVTNNNSNGDLSESKSIYKNRFVYDTPGVFSSKSIVNYLKNNELASVNPTKTKIKPLTYILKPGQSIMFDGCGRLDYISSPSMDAEPDAKIPNVQVLRVTVFSKIPIHLTSIKKANKLFEKLHAGEKTVLIPPVNIDPERLSEFPRLKEALNFTIDGNHASKAWMDVCFSGIGWFSLTGLGKDFHIAAYSPNGAGVSTRDPMLPFEYKHWIKKYTSNLRKTLN